MAKDLQKAKKPERARAARPDIPRVRSDNFQVIYSNFVQCGRSAWDIALAFSMLSESEPDKPAVIDLVNVVMTPPLAKALIGVLNAHIKMYEQENGEIRIPASITRQVAAAQAEGQEIAGAPKAELQPA